jgi:hypothetical protein
LITCFDGKLLFDKLKGKSNLTFSYTNNSGIKTVFSDIIKVYDDNDDQTIGMGIDLYNSMISNPNTYYREYLVFPEFLQNSLKENCGLEIVETDYFVSLFNLYRNYFLHNENNIITFDDLSKKRFEEIRQFYLNLAPNEHSVTESNATFASFKFTMLNRYYVFRKTAITNIEPSRIIGINHQLDTNNILIPYFNSNQMLIDYNKKSDNMNKLYKAIVKKYQNQKPSVYLIRHEIIKDEIDDLLSQRNYLKLLKLKEGNTNKILLVYKSPDKYFYPICYQKLNYNEITDPSPIEKIRKTFLIDSDKIVDDLDVLVELFNK